MEYTELNNGILKILINKDNGTIARIENIQTGLVHVDSTGDRSKYGRLFRMILPKKDWPFHYADSHSYEKN
jgi:hypothetical protein